MLQAQNHHDTSENRLALLMPLHWGPPECAIIKVMCIQDYAYTYVASSTAHLSSLFGVSLKQAVVRTEQVAYTLCNHCGVLLSAVISC